MIVNKKQLAEIFRQIEISTVFVLVSLIILSIFTQVISRYIFKISISWLEELARFSFIWAALYGGSIAYRRGVLHKFEIPYSPRITVIVSGITNLLILFFLGIMVIYGFKLSLFVCNQYSPALKIRMIYVYLAVPVSTGMMFFYTVNDLVINFTKGKSV